jgi:hypothetical protein
MTAKDLLIDLVEYVEQVHRLSERVVTRLQDYRDLVLHETDLKGREGVQRTSLRVAKRSGSRSTGYAERSHRSRRQR